ncbi:MAG: hypothetical protein AAFU73_13585 [Planctomycetota bacterium]
MRTRTLLLALLCAALAAPSGAQTVRARRRPTPAVSVPGRAGPLPTPCSRPPLVDPAYRDPVDLSPWQLCGSRAWPFSAAYTPDGEELYVTLFGGLVGSGGCAVVRLDPDTFQLRGTVMTGESPEELAFVTRPDGSLVLGFVTDSSASSVTVFDASDTTVATIPIPADPNGSFGTAFPYGLAVSPDQSTVHVGTLDGGGIIHAIDVASLQLDPARAIDLGSGAGVSRMAFVGPELTFGVTRFFPGLTGSEAEFAVVDPRNPAAVRSVVLGSANNTGRFPSPQDVAVACNGTVWLAGFDLGARVFNIDPAGPTVVASVPTLTSQPDGKFQALGLSPDGLLVVSDFFTNEVATIDANRLAWRSILDLSSVPASHRAAQDVVFSPDGRTMVVPWAASDDLAVFDL